MIAWYRWGSNLPAIGQQNLPIRNVPARFYDIAAKDPVASGLACYWSKNPPIRNVSARFYDMAAETSGDAKGTVAHGLA